MSNDLKTAENKSKKKLKDFVRDQVTSMFTGILDFTEVAVGEKERHRVLRGKILRLSNDTIRDIQKEIDDRYDISYLAPSEDVIVVKNKVQR